VSRGRSTFFDWKSFVKSERFHSWNWR